MQKTKRFLFVLMLMVLSFAGVQTISANAADSKSTTNVNKAWTVHFAQQLDANSVTSDRVYIKNEQGQTVATTIQVDGKKVIVSPKAAYPYGSYTLYVEPTIKAINGHVLTQQKTLSFNVQPVSQDDVVLTKAGTYSDNTYGGNVEIQQAGTLLKNTVIEGDLTIAASVAEGEVYLDNVIVKGETKILGGGTNSVYVKDTTLTTVIVNKANGMIRVVVEGNTVVQQVSLESHAILEEQNLQAEGFTEILIQERLANQNGEVELKGKFTKVQNFATGLDLTLATDTELSELILAAVTNVTGNAHIQNLQVALNGSGSTLDVMPEQAQLDDNASIKVDGEQITGNISAATTTEIKSIEVNTAFTQIHFSNALYNLTLADFVVTATGEDGNVVELQNISYSSATGMLTYNLPSSFSQQYLVLEVAANPASTKVTGYAEQSFYTTVGITGRVTDIYGTGIANAVVTSNNEARVTTNKAGYYFMPVYMYDSNSERVTLTVTSVGYAAGNIYADVDVNTSVVTKDLTLIRAAASDEWKIRLTWNGEERDVDSHLASEYFHVYYGQSIYAKNGYEYVDLDWDDTDYYGPETTTIRKFEDGRYVFFLHNYSGNRPLEVSESRVELFKGNSTVADLVYDVPSKTNGENYWGVFELLVSNNGQNVEVVELDTMAFDENILKTPKAYLKTYIDTLDLNASHKEGFTAALNNAKQVMNKTSVTTKEYIEAFNELYVTVAKAKDFTSSSQALRLRTYDAIDYYLPNKFDLTFLMDSANNESVYHLMPGDNINVYADVVSYDENWDYIESDITIRNKATGETFTLTNGVNQMLVANMSYEQLLAKNNTQYEVVLAEPGYFEINIQFEVTNRTYDDSGMTYKPFDNMWLTIETE